jgi:heme oxygenase
MRQVYLSFTTRGFDGTPSDWQNIEVLTQTFHDQIKAATDSSHRSAERTDFIVDLMGGTLNQSAYLRYLEALAPIYERMEVLLRERATRPLIVEFDHRGLDRFSLLEADITALRESGKVTEGPTIPLATKSYVSRLGTDIEDERLLAHHYIRYLGDLSGGQAIARLVARHYQIPQEALAFSDFHGLGDANTYKVAYREKLNRAALTDAQKDAFIDEAVALYSLSREIFQELGRA